MLYRPQITSSWKIDSNFEYISPIEIFVDFFPKTIPQKNTIRIIIIQESYNTDWLLNIMLDDKYYDYYSYVFTHNKILLNKNPKAVPFLCIKTWIKDFYFEKKIFNVTTVVGGKKYPNLEGHVLRHILWKRQNEIKIPKEFYLSSHYKYKDADYNNSLILGESKNILFNSQYHIVIENTKLENVFTEKIIDCFQTKTIPIYYGAPNIKEFFNLDGIIVVNDIDEVINVCNNLTPDIYYEKIDAIEENYNKSLRHISQTNTLDNTLYNLLIENNKIIKI